jgi:protoporphyrin/coproporphyrin ferrochelatase
MAKTAVLLTAYGGPDSVESVGPFMRNLMGREPDPEVVRRAELKYLAIGGSSPLPARTAEIATALDDRLREDGHGVQVMVGMRYWDPTIASAVDRLVDDGAERIIQVSLSPFESAISSGAYRTAMAEAAASHPGLEVVETPSFYDSPDFRQALADGASEAIADLPGERGLTIFTAHSLPVKDAEADPRYVDQLEETVLDVAALAGLPQGARGTEVLPGVEALGHAGDRAWLFAYQSRGAARGDWLGPSLEDVIDAAVAAGFDGVSICPVGFATDHMETLYDLDIVAADRALTADIEVTRAAVPNASPELISALASRLEPLL